MSQPPVYPSGGYPPDPRSQPGHGRSDRQPGYSDSGQSSYPGYGQYGGQPGYPDDGQSSRPGYGQYGGQPGYPEDGQGSYPGYGQQAGQPYAGGYPQSPAPSYPGYSQAHTPPPPKKSKAGKIVLIILATLLVVCGGGSAVAYFALKDDVKDVVDATQTRLIAPETLAGRPKIADADLQKAADEMVVSMKKDLPNATSTIAGFYGDIAKKDMVMIAGASALISDPAKELDKAIVDLGTGGLKVTNAKTVDPGPLGGSAKCGDAAAEGVAMGVCIWADRGSLGMIVIYFKTGDQAKTEFVKIRGEVEQRK